MDPRNFESSVGALDRDEHLWGSRGSGRWPRRDVDRHIVMVGVRGELTAKLTSTFRIGYESRHADSRNGTDHDGPVASGDFVFKINGQFAKITLSS